MKNVFVVDALRTPIGKYGGALSTVRPDDMLAHTIRQLVARTGVPPHQIEEVIAGAANQSGEDNRNVARMAALLAGLPVTVAGSTVNRLCASGLQAIIDASRAIAVGDATVMIAAGVESMSRAPFVMAKPAEAFGRSPEMYDTTMGWRFVNPALSALYHPYTMGETAENVARQYQISRADQDAFALASQEKYAAAEAAGKWEAEVLPVSIPQKKGAALVVSGDEHPRPTSIEALASLRPAFVKEGTVTAGNSSGINDGAAAMLLVNEQALASGGWQPLARVAGMAVAGVDPAVMGIAPVPAVQKLLQRTGLSLADIGLFELNEAFAAQSLACIRQLDIDPALVNVNGGAIALGHPLGCSGVRISTTLLYEMRRRQVRYGIATMCVGVGQGAAVLFENVGL